MEFEKIITLDDDGSLKAYIDYRNVDRIYSLAHKMHGVDNMRDYHTWVFNLRSPERITEIIDNGGEYILLEHREEPIGLVCLCLGDGYRPLDAPYNPIKIDEWEIGSLLIHEKFRERGFAKKLFRLAMERLKEKTGASKAHVIVTGTFDRKRLGEPREMSKGVTKLCQEFDGRLVGYGKDSYGPVYELNIS